MKSNIIYCYLIMMLVGCASAQVVHPPIPVAQDCISIDLQCVDHYGEEIVDTVQWAADEWRYVGGRDLKVEVNSQCPFKFHCGMHADDHAAGRADMREVSIESLPNPVFEEYSCGKGNYFVPNVVLHEMGHFNSHKQHSMNYDVMSAKIPRCDAVEVPKDIDWKKVR